jgi:hypothetical protein
MSSKGVHRTMRQALRTPHTESTCHNQMVIADTRRYHECTFPDCPAGDALRALVTEQQQEVQAAAVAAAEAAPHEPATSSGGDSGGSASSDDSDGDDTLGRQQQVLLRDANH